MENKFKNISIILGVAVIILLLFVAFSQGKKYGTAQKTILTSNSSAPRTNTGINISSSVNKTLDEANAELADNPVLKNAEVEATNANPIKDNVVVTLEGKPTVNSSTPMAPDAPQQTPPINKDQLSDKAIQLNVSKSGFSPNQFTVKAGSALTLAITGTDQFTHLFKFDDPSLNAVRILISSGETKAITFNAPTKAGEYSFKCSLPGHEKERGKMIVK